MDKTKEPYNIYALTWVRQEGQLNIGSESINAAWEARESQLLLPVAIRPTCVHTRMTVQKSCFTVHGRSKKGLDVLLSREHLEKYLSEVRESLKLSNEDIGVFLSREYLKKYSIDDNSSEEILNELRQMGISEGTLFPSLDGLARDLTRLFRPDLVNQK
jgi:hypothetical protein